MSAPPPLRRSPPAFAPRFTLSLIYLFGFFFLYCVLLILPVLFEVQQGLPPDVDTNPAAGEAAVQAAAAAAQAAFQPRIWIAILASVLTTTLGAHFRVLPGLREG